MKLESSILNPDLEDNSKGPSITISLIDKNPTPFNRDIRSSDKSLSRSTKRESFFDFWLNDELSGSEACFKVHTSFAWSDISIILKK